MRECGERFREFRKDTIAALEQHEPQIALGDRVVGAHCFAQEIVHLRDALHAGETATGHDKRQQSPANFRVALCLCVFQRADELIAQIERVAQVFERTRVIPHTGDFRVIEARTHGEHQVIVAEQEMLRSRAWCERDHTRIEIDRLDIARVKPDRRRHAADRRDDVIQFHRAGDHLRK